MNFFDGPLEKGAFVLGDRTISIPRETLDVLNSRGYEGKHLTLGIRPEHIHVNSEDLSGLPVSEFDATITVSELTGAETILYATYAEQEFIARVEADTAIEPGHTARLAFDMSHAHFFDTENGMRIKAENSDKSFAEVESVL